MKRINTLIDWLIADGLSENNNSFYLKRKCYATPSAAVFQSFSCKGIFLSKKNSKKDSAAITEIENVIK